MTAYDDLTAAVDLTVKASRYLSKGREKIIRDAALVLRGAVVEPPPPPPPPDPEPVLEPIVGKAQINLYCMLTTEHCYYLFERYQRWINHVVYKAGEVRDIKFGATNVVPGGGDKLAHAHPEYGYTLNGIVVARIKASLELRTTFKLNVDALPPEIVDGPYQEGFVAYDAAGKETPILESVVPFWVWVDRHGKAKDRGVAIWQSGTYEFVHNGGVYWWAQVPVALINPRARPIVPRAGEPFDTALPNTALTRVNLVPHRKNDAYIPCIDENGIWTFANRHVYFINDLETADLWVLPSVDGPRGIGTVAAPLWCWPGRKGGAYVTELNRFAHVNTDGTVQTLVGHVDPFPASYWRDKAKMKGRAILKGNWSNIPVERHGARFGWGGVFVSYTLETDPASPLVDGENTHVTGPRVLLPCRRHGRILACTFDPKSHATPPVVTEAITGLGEPWCITEGAGVLYVSDRKANKVLAYDIKTFAKLDWELPFLAPEGIGYHDGQLYIGSRARQAVYKVDVATKAETFFFKPTITAKSEFVFVSVNVTAGPPSLFVSTFAEMEFGRAQTLLLDGSIPPKGWGWHGYERLSEGAGGQTEAWGYSTATGAAHNAIVYGGMDHGLAQMTKTVPTDPKPNLTTYLRGKADYYARGLQVLHGADGHGFLDLPKPWGLSADIDYYLSWNGHKAA